MLARLFRFSTELSARRSLRGGLVSAIRPLAFLSAAACVSSVQADEIDVWRQAFLSRWIGATTNGEWQLPPAIGAALAPKLETTESSETAEAPSSRRKIRQTSAMVGETAPLRLMPRDVQAQYLEDADPSLVWEPQRPPYPKVVRSRHVERTEPALAHDPARVRAAIRANPEAMPLPEDPRILRTSDEVIVETTTPAQPTATITASPAEPPQKCVAPSDDEPQNDAAAAIADIMEKLGGALEGSEF
ncbi:MAG TPA: hypothetical protein VGE52_02545, partial [Pirellulales bacterium]